MKIISSTCLIAILVIGTLALAAGLAEAKDKDNNPPGPVGGQGTNWENPKGPVGGPGASPDRGQPGGDGQPPYGKAYGYHKDRDNNPPGPKGGPGSNWEKNDRKEWKEVSREDHSADQEDAVAYTFLTYDRVRS